MRGSHSRRDFLRIALASTAGLGLAPLVSGFRGSTRGRPMGGSAGFADDLPPRVIGLRTMGGDFRFDPVGLRLEPGDAVTWLNMGDFHTASAFHPDNDDLLGGSVPLRIPERAESFHSGMLGITGGTEFTYRPTVEGVYDYFCQPHYSFGMVGRVIVGAPGNGPAVTRPLSELNEPSRETMPAVERIMGPRGRAFEWASRLNGLLYLRASGEDGRPAAAPLERRVEADDELASLLEGAGQAPAFRRALRTFLEAYTGDAGYERLSALADDAKAPLREAGAAGG